MASFEKRVMSPILVLMGVALFASSTATPSAAGDAVGGESADWPSYGRTSSEQFYSPLKDISDQNVQRLGLAWYLDLPGERTLEATPLAVDGVLYFSGTYGKTYAVDARSGRLLWTFDAHSGDYRPDIFRFSGSMGGHRGVAYWQGRVYVAVVDGRLFALNARTGKVIWSVQTFDDANSRKAISGAPRVFKGKVIIGNNGDLGSRGYVTAYDARTGQRRWRFYTVPGDPSKGFESEAMAMAAGTWSGQWWESGGNGSVWDSIVYDPAFNHIYLATANWIPANWIPANWIVSEKQGTWTPSKGDHLFASSVVALDADSGRYRWHYQENPRGDWDYDSNAPMVLADLAIGGEPHKVLMHAPKNGFFYVIDRANGRLLSAEKFTKVTWASRVDLKSGRPVEIPGVRELWPNFLGAHSWQPMSFNPGTGLMYIPTLKMGMVWGEPAEGVSGNSSHGELDDRTATLLAWDPVAQRKRWEVPYTDSLFNGGTMTTAGNLVFQGTGRGQFIAYSASTGENLWSFYAGVGVIAAPTSYAIDGQQYVSVLVGYGGSGGILGKLADYGWRFDEQPRRLLTFALDRHLPLPPGKPPRFKIKAIDSPSLVIDQEQAARGAKLYQSALCGFCHGAQLENVGSFAPDLRESALAAAWPAFRSVLHEGALANLGMPKFGHLTEDKMRAIYLYIRQGARDAIHSSNDPTKPSSHGP